MGTIRAGDRETHTIQAGAVLLVTADAVSSGLWRRRADPSSAPLAGQTSIAAGATTQIGPFTDPAYVQVECSAGSLVSAPGIPATAADVGGGAGLDGLSGPEVLAARALVSGAGIVRPTTSMLKRLGTAASQFSTSALQTSWLMKVCLEGDFDQVRLWWPNYNAATYSVVAAAVAATESWGVAGYADAAWQPYVGAAKIAGIDSVTDAYGWRSSNFSGSRAGTIAARLGLHTDGSTPRISWTASDWADCASVPNTDRVSTYQNQRYLIIKAFIDGVATPYNYLNIQSAGTLRDISVVDAVNRGRTFMTARVDGNTNIVTTPDSGAPSVGFQGPYLPLLIEYRSRQKGVSVAWAGDSLAAFVYGNSTDGGSPDFVLSPVHRACAIASTQALPMEPVNCGMGAKNSDAYQQAMLDMIAAGIKPNIVVYHVMTPNDTRTTAGAARISFRKQLRKLAELSDAVSAYGGIVMVFTPQPMQGVTAAVDAERQWLAAQITQMATLGRVRVVPIREAVTATLGASSESWIPALTWDSVLHWNEAGVEVASQLVGQYLKAIFVP